MRQEEEDQGSSHTFVADVTWELGSGGRACFTPVRVWIDRTAEVDSGNGKKIKLIVTSTILKVYFSFDFNSISYTIIHVIPTRTK